MQISPLALRVPAYMAPRAAVLVPPGGTMETFTPSPMPMFAITALMRAAIAPVTVALAGTPVQLTLNDLRWPRPAQRELEEHLKERGLRREEPLANLVRAELAQARKLDRRVQASDMLKAINLAEKAQRLEPIPQNDLFAFTRLTDSKFPLTTALADSLENEGAPQKLMQSLDKALGSDGQSEQFNMDTETADWLARTLNALGTPTRETMGGAGAFCANLAACQPNVRVGFWALSGLPARVAAGMHPAITVYDDQGGRRRPADAIDASQPDRVNYIGEYRGVASGRLILTSPGSQEIGFGGAPQATLENTIQGKQLFFFAGIHYLTKDPTKVGAVADDLRTMKSANPDCLFHLQYVKPKDPDHEKVVLEAVKSSVDSMSLNSVELATLLERIQPGYDGVKGDSKRDVLEEPRNILSNLYHLRDTMELKRVHVHGMHGDMILARTPKDKERTILAVMKARQLAAMKATNESGQVAIKSEMWPLLPLVEGTCLAAVQRFADGVKERFNLTDAQRAQVARDWFYDDGQGNTLFFVPSRGIHDRSGGTVSLGDTIDAATLIYSMEAKA